MTNWSDPAGRVTSNFTVKEACFLPSWGVLHQPSAEEKANLLRLCLTMERLRKIIGKPINVHCMLRPNKANAPGSEHDGKDYNKFIKGAKRSAHLTGLACDFSVTGMTCDEVRALLLPGLLAVGIRMEDLPGSSWVHVDLLNPLLSGGRRYFKP